MKKVSGTNHDHQKFVVNMLGCVTLQEPMMLVLEYAICGDLLSYLRDSRDEVCMCKMYVVMAALQALLCVHFFPVYICKLYKCSLL